jgi:phosphatidylserine decarboxylase
VVIRKGNNEVLVKQIAGALARRIVNYLEVGQKVSQGEEMGFIKFGSRVDLLLPLSAKVNVGMNETVQGGVTVIASI